MDILSENGLISRRIIELQEVRPNSVEPPFPKTMYLEISNLCNHSCVFCAYPKMTRVGGRMNPDLEANIKFAKEVGYEYVFITTNGSIATESRLAACIDNGLDSIKFSINGGDRETYARIHGKDHFDRVMSNVRFVDRYRKDQERNVYLGVSFVMIDTPELGSNLETQDELKAVVESFVDEVIFYEANMSHGQMVGLAPMEIDPPCPLPFTRLHISVEGYLRMCCSDYQNYLTLVDLNCTHLKEAWHSDIYKRMRQRHLDGRLEGTLCHNCLHNCNDPVEPIVPELAHKVEQQYFLAVPPRIDARGFGRT